MSCTLDCHFEVYIKFFFKNTLSIKQIPQQSNE